MKRQESAFGRGAHHSQAGFGTGHGVHTLSICVVAAMFVVPSVFPARAQEPAGTPLTAVIERALSASPRLKAADEAARAAHARIGQVTAWDDPTFAFEFFSTPITSINPFKDGLENDYSLQQMIPFPGKKRLMGDMARAGARMSEQNARAAKLEIAARVTESYGMLWSAQQRLAITRENRVLISRMIESARANYAGGRMQADGVLRLELEAARLANDSAAYALEAAAAGAMLDAACGSEQQSGPIIAMRPDAPPLPATADEAIAKALELRPELLGMQYETDMFRSEAAMWEKERLPDFMIRAMYKEMRFHMPDSWALMVGINISIAPWASGKYDARIEEAEARRRASEATREDMRAMIGAETREQWTKTRSLGERLERTRAVVLPLAEQIFVSLLSRFQTGESDYIAVLDALRMISMARMDEAMLEGELAAAAGRLARAMGGTR